MLVDNEHINFSALTTTMATGVMITRRLDILLFDSVGIPTPHTETKIGSMIGSRVTSPTVIGSPMTVLLDEVFQLFGKLVEILRLLSPFFRNLPAKGTHSRLPGDTKN